MRFLLVSMTAIEIIIIWACTSVNTIRNQNLYIPQPQLFPSTQDHHDQLVEDLLNLPTKVTNTYNVAKFKHLPGGGITPTYIKLWQSM